MSGFALAIAAFGAFAAIAPVLARLTRRSPLAALVVAALLAHLGGLVAGTRLSMTIPYFAYAGMQAFLTAAYVFAFGALYKSVSLSLLGAAGGGVLPDAKVDAHVGILFDSRCDGLVAGGHAARMPEGYRVTARGLSLARCLSRLRSWLAIRKPGFYTQSSRR